MLERTNYHYDYCDMPQVARPAMMKSDLSLGNNGKKKEAITGPVPTNRPKNRRQYQRV